MKLGEFIHHIKHRSLSIKIYDMDNNLLYDGDVGQYLNSVYRYDNYIVKYIYPEDDLLMLYLKC